MIKYFPILLSKDGEIRALTHLEQAVKIEICPVIEMLPNRVNAVSQFLLRHWTFDDNEVIIDFSWFDGVPQASVVIRGLFRALFNAGVNAIPAIQINSAPSYITIVQNLVATHDCKVCIRTSNQSGGFVNYNADVNSLVARVGVATDHTILLLDLGYAEQHNFNMLATIASVSITALRPTRNHWDNIVVASSSFPVNLSQFVPPHRVYRIPRLEWDIWNLIHTNPALASVKYGDFGTKFPMYANAPFAGTISVKYTTDTEYVIHRGELTDHHVDGHGQYITHALRLIRSADYSGAGFSWGDHNINEIAHEVINSPTRRTGNPGSWVQFSQNHHITLLHSLL